MDGRPADAIYRGNVARLLEKVRDERGLDLSQYRPRYVERRLAVRLNAVGVHTYRQYAARLDADPAEYARLLDALTINVTQFFRDPSVYDLFRAEVLPELLRAKSARKQRILRVWSAGCATGEEPYSLVMALLAEAERHREWTFMPTVIGTDIDRAALAVAKKAEYPLAELTHIPADVRERFVEVTGDTFRVRDSVTKHARFQYLNLFEDPPLTSVDVVFCRNVFIYFNHDQQERMLTAFWESLGRGGYLVLGRSERLSPALARKFELVSARERIYRKPLELQ